MLDFGWIKATSLLSAPFLGVSFNITKPSLLRRAISDIISETSKAIWWTPSPFFSINFAIGLSGFVASNNSILLGPVLKKEVFTPSLATSSTL
mgnify:CR=1 FL=1